MEQQWTLYVSYFHSKLRIRFRNWLFLRFFQGVDLIPQGRSVRMWILETESSVRGRGSVTRGGVVMIRSGGSAL